MTRRGLLRGAAGIGALSALGACAAPGGGGGGAARSPEAAFPPLGRFVEVEGVRIHHVEAGEGPPIVLIHGANGNLRDFTFSMVGRISDRFRVIAVDRPGLGYSERPATGGADPRVQARLIAGAAEALGAERTLVVGHSWGGAVAAAWALDRPDQVAGAAILAGATHPWGGGGGLLYGLGASFAGPLVGALARSYVRGESRDRLVSDVFAPNPVPEGYAEYVGVELALRPDTFLWNAEDIDRLNGFLAEMAPRYGELAMPLEVMHGDADETVGLEIHSMPLAAAARNANLTIFPGVGHMLHHAREAQVVEGFDRLAVAAGFA